MEVAGRRLLHNEGSDLHWTHLPLPFAEELQYAQTLLPPSTWLHRDKPQIRSALELLEEVDDPADEVRRCGVLDAELPEINQRADRLAVHLERLESLQGFGDKSAHLGRPALFEESSGPLQADQNSFVLQAGADETVFDLGEDVLGAPELSQTREDDPFEPSQLEELQRLSRERLPEAAPQEKPAPFPILATFG